MSSNTFKAQLDSIKYEDILKLRQAKEKHPIKLEDLEMSLKTGNEYIEVMRDFLESIGFSSDRIDSFECRRRDGYFPHTYNKGGLEGITYRDQYSACENTGFSNTDAVLSRYRDYSIECFAEENSLDPKTYADWTDEQREACHEFESNNDDTIQFQARIMMTSETTANVDLYVSASDSPYHRSSDDKLELEIEFKSPAGMKRKLNSILKHVFVKCFASNIKEAW